MSINIEVLMHPTMQTNISTNTAYEYKIREHIFREWEFEKWHWTATKNNNVHKDVVMT